MAAWICCYATWACRTGMDVIFLRELRAHTGWTVSRLQDRASRMTLIAASKQVLPLISSSRSNWSD